MDMRLSCLQGLIAGHNALMPRGIPSMTGEMQANSDSRIPNIMTTVIEKKAYILGSAQTQ